MYRYIFALFFKMVLVKKNGFKHSRDSLDLLGNTTQEMP